MLKTLKSLPLASRAIIALAVVGVVACAVFAVQPARSALISSSTYEAEVSQSHIGVALIEKTGDEASWREVSQEGDLLPLDALFLEGEAQAVKVGVLYPEQISARNTSDDRGEYVRLTVRKYWSAPEAVDPAEAPTETSGSLGKTETLDPSLIQLQFDEANGGDWVYSSAESTAERLVFYYKHLLEPGADANTPAITGFSVSKNLVTVASRYENAQVSLDAQVDSVQKSKAAEAARSAWGVDIEELGLDWSGE